MDGSTEEETSKVFKREIEGCEFFVDVGAEHGYYTILAIDSMKKGAIVTFEPDINRFEVLEKKLMDVDTNLTLVAINKCVGDYDGEIELYVGSTPSVVKSISSIKKRLLNKSVQAPICKLDTVLIDEPIDLIKIDVEGFEIGVLEGCVEIMKKHKPKMIIEIHDSFLRTFGKSPKDVYDIMSAHGYSHELIEVKENLKKKNRIEMVLFK